MKLSKKDNELINRSGRVNIPYSCNFLRVAQLIQSKMIVARIEKNPEDAVVVFWGCSHLFDARENERDVIPYYHFYYTETRSGRYKFIRVERVND